MVRKRTVTYYYLTHVPECCHIPYSARTHSALYHEYDSHDSLLDAIRENLGAIESSLNKYDRLGEGEEKMCTDLKSLKKWLEFTLKEQEPTDLVVPPLGMGLEEGD